MHWFYQLQQRLALTPTESVLLLTISGLFVFGFAVEQWLEPAPPTRFEEQYAATDSALVAGAERLAADSTAEVPATSQAPAMAETPRASRAPSRQPVRVNLNTATSADLQKLPGIGPAIAQRILDYRAANGSFSDVSQLTRVRGIGPKTLEKLRPWLYVE